MNSLLATHGVLRRRVVGHVTSGRDNEITRISNAVEEINNGFHVVLLVAEQHDGRQRDVSGHNNVVAVGDLLRFGEVNVLVHRDAVGRRLAHLLNILGRISADEEGGESAACADRLEEPAVRLMKEFGEVIRRDLGDQGVHGGDHIRTRLHVVPRHGLADTSAVVEEIADVVGIVEHIHEDGRSP